MTDTAQGQQTDQDAEQQARHGYKRVLLKLGGEMFGGGQVGLDPDVVQKVAMSGGVATITVPGRCSSGR